MTKRKFKPLEQKLKETGKLVKNLAGNSSMRKPLASGKTLAYQQKYNLCCSKSPIINSSSMHKWHIMQEMRMGREFNQDALRVMKKL